jgi:hypothetical protein
VKKAKAKHRKRHPRAAQQMLIKMLEAKIIRVIDLKQNRPVAD